MILGTMKGNTKRATRRAKKSFTLSPSSVAFLDELRRERQAASTSLVLDQLIRNAEAMHRRQTAEESIAAYYSSLSPEEQKEQEAWGEFALEQWTGEAT